MRLLFFNRTSRTILRTVTKQIYASTNVNSFITVNIKVTVQQSSFCLEFIHKQVWWLTDVTFHTMELLKALSTLVVQIYFQIPMFVCNEGVSIYLSQQQLHIDVDVLFKNNKAVAGGGIFGSISVVIFKNNSNATFHNNSVITDGGAIFINNSVIYFAENSFILPHHLVVHRTP